jgi:hypothetical protein
MDNIPNLYNGINFITLPKSIYDELITNSNDRSFTSHRNDNGEFVTVDGEYLRPFFIYFNGEYNFYINHKHIECLEYRLKKGNCFDKDYNKIDVQNIYPFYKYYNDGFIKGYNEFENSLKNNTSLFSVTNEQIAFKIYSRVTRSEFLSEKNGSFKLVNDSFSNKETDKRICKENGIQFTIKILEENFFESGFYGGEFYKAWEIILNNPTVFEPIFERHIKSKNKITESEPQQLEPEAIDLSKTTATEKIIYLQKLGVIDFLRTKQPFNTSINSLATVISAITGVNPETKHIQSMLNPMISKEVGQKNNPLNSKNTVSKVEKQLINIGFNLNETN